MVRKSCIGNCVSYSCRINIYSVCASDGGGVTQKYLFEPDYGPLLGHGGEVLYLTLSLSFGDDRVGV